MASEQMSSHTESSTEKKEFFTRKAKIMIFFWQIVAVFFWIYALSQIFVFDIDNFLIAKEFLLLTSVVTYKFIFLFGILAISWLYAGNVTMLFFVIYIMFYPLILFLWKIPKLIWKANNLILTIAVINVVVSFFYSIKFVFISFALILVCSSLIYLNSNQYILYTSILLLTVLLIIIYIQRFIIILRPSSLYQIHSKIITKLFSFTKDAFKADETIKITPFEQLSKTQLEKWGSNLETLVIFNRSCYFLSSKLNEYQKSNFKLVFYIANLFILITLTTFIFAVANFGLYKINPNHFQITINPDFFIFIYYSISNLFARSVNEIVPFATISRVFSMIQLLFSFLLLVIIVTLVFSFQNQRDSNQIIEAINHIKEQGIEMDNYIQDEYKLTIEQSITELEKIKVSSIKIIYYLIQNTD